MTKWMLATLAVAVLAAGCRGTEWAASTTSPATDNGSQTAGGTSAAAAQPAPAVPDYRDVTLPEGTTLALEMKSAVASDTSHVEDPVRATLHKPVTIAGHEVLPPGTAVVGAVTSAAKSGRVTGRAQVAFRFTALDYDGTRYDMKTASITRKAEATKGEDATKIGIGAGAGAVMGAIFGGGGGAAKGAAVGGAAGTGLVLATKGKEVHLGPGANVATRLTAPLTIRIRDRG